MTHYLSASCLELIENYKPQGCPYRYGKIYSGSVIDRLIRNKLVPSDTKKILTDKKLQVLYLSSLGYSQLQIAAALKIGEQTSTPNNEKKINSVNREMTEVNKVAKSILKKKGIHKGNVKTLLDMELAEQQSEITALLKKDKYKEIVKDVTKEDLRIKNWHKSSLFLSRIPDSITKKLSKEVDTNLENLIDKEMENLKFTLTIEQKEEFKNYILEHSIVHHQISRLTEK